MKMQHERMAREIADAYVGMMVRHGIDDEVSVDREDVFFDIADVASQHLGIADPEMVNPEILEAATTAAIATMTAIKEALAR